jgi:superkiller protein 3
VGRGAGGVGSEADVFNEQGKRAYEADDLDTAITEFQQALALDPANADYQTNLAVAFDEREMDDEAFAAYQRALELNPRQVTALLNIGYLYSEQEQFEEARQVWEQVVRVDPASEEAQEARDNLRNLDEL